MLGFLAINASVSCHVYEIANTLPCCFHGPLHQDFFLNCLPFLLNSKQVIDNALHFLFGSLFQVLIRLGSETHRFGEPWSTSLRKFQKILLARCGLTVTYIPMKSKWCFSRWILTWSRFQIDWLTSGVAWSCNLGIWWCWLQNHGDSTNIAGFSLALKPDEFQLPPVVPSWNEENVGGGQGSSNQL